MQLVLSPYVCACMFIQLSYGMCVHGSIQIYLYTHMHVGVCFRFIVDSYQWTTSDPAMVNSKASPGFFVSKAKPLNEIIEV